MFTHSVCPKAIQKMPPMERNHGANTDPNRHVLQTLCSKQELSAYRLLCSPLYFFMLT